MLDDLPPKNPPTGFDAGCFEFVVGVDAVALRESSTISMSTSLPGDGVDFPLLFFSSFSSSTSLARVGDAAVTVSVTSVFSGRGGLAPISSVSASLTGSESFVCVFELWTLSSSIACQVIFLRGLDENTIT